MEFGINFILDGAKSSMDKGLADTGKVNIGWPCWGQSPAFKRLHRAHVHLMCNQQMRWSLCDAATSFLRTSPQDVRILSRVRIPGSPRAISIWGGELCCAGGPVCQRVFNSLPGPYPLGTSHPPPVTIKNVSRNSHICPLGEKLALMAQNHRNM